MKKKNDNFSFQIQLLLDILKGKNYPFTKLVIEKSLTEDEYQVLLTQLEELNEEYLLQKQQGFLNFSSLLVNFAGMLNEKLLPEETIFALKSEGLYMKMMGEFIKIIGNEYKD